MCISVVLIGVTLVYEKIMDAARDQEPFNPRPQRQLTYLLVLVAVLGVGLTGLASYFAANQARNETNSHLATEVQRLESRILARMENYANALLHVQALFKTRAPIERSDFREFFSAMQVDKKYPGIQAISFVSHISSENVAQLEARVRGEGFPDFQVWPDKPRRSEFAPILFIEPFDWRNRRAFGYDILTEPIRSAALDLARDTGEAVISQHITLVQETPSDAQPGFIFCLPVYKKGFPTSTIMERRKALLGYISAPFRARDLFSHIFAEEYGPESSLDVAIFDGDAIEPTAEIYSNPKTSPNRSLDASTLTATRKLNLYKRNWILHVRTLPGFERSSAIVLARGILFFGLALTALLMFLVYSAKSHAEAEINLVRKNEAARKQNEIALLNALEARDEFISIASHELKTPMSTLRLQLQIFIRAIRNSDANLLGTARLERTATMADTQLTRLSQLVNSLLDVSSISIGRFELHKKTFNLTELLDDLVVRLSPEITSARSTVNLLYDANLPTCYADPIRLEQILTNLITNSTRYAPRSELTIRASHLNNSFVLSVSDNGPGIKIEDQQRIFARFERVTQTRCGGMGLGLYISKQIAEAHGGSIEVMSKPGHGSSFAITFPDGLADQATRIERAPESARLHH